MRRSSWACFCILGMLGGLSVGSIYGQQNATIEASGLKIELPAPDRNPEAIALLQRSLGALGSRAAFESHGSFVAQGVYSDQVNHKAGVFTWTHAGEETRSEMVDSETANISIYASGHGQPVAHTHGIKATRSALSALSPLAIHLPLALIVKFLDDESASITWVDEEQVRGKTVERVRLSYASDPKHIQLPDQVWLIDAATALPVELDMAILLQTHLHPDLGYSAQFDSYKQIAGLMVPFLVETRVKGKTDILYTIQSMVLDTTVPDSIFDVADKGTR